MVPSPTGLSKVIAPPAAIAATKIVPEAEASIECTNAPAPAETEQCNPPTALQVAKTYFDAFTGTPDSRKTLAALYSPQAHFSDNMFKFANRDGILRMWKSVSPDFKASYTVVGVNGNDVHVTWQADYTLLGHKIHNDVDSHLTVVNGQIVNQVENWDFIAWAKQEFPLLTEHQLSANRPGITAFFNAAIYL